MNRTDHYEWNRSRNRLVTSVTSLGFPEELGDAIARNLGSPKAMERMIAYLENVRPGSEELVVDEMLAICSEIDAWRKKKACEEANAKYNEILNHGLGDEGHASTGE
ncbi:MAG: hypothetical protein K5696_11595 [Lachnospiraceae bacterium]|nr:hypothetical protein [Lachnospiraceae bacterium]